MCPWKRYVAHFYITVCRVNLYITYPQERIPWHSRLHQMLWQWAALKDHLETNFPKLYSYVWHWIHCTFNTHWAISSENILHTTNNHCQCVIYLQRRYKKNHNFSSKHVSYARCCCRDQEYVLYCKLMGENMCNWHYMCWVWKGNRNEYLYSNHSSHRHRIIHVCLN